MKFFPLEAFDLDVINSVYRAKFGDGTYTINRTHFIYYLSTLIRKGLFHMTIDEVFDEFQGTFSLKTYFQKWQFKRIH